MTDLWLVLGLVVFFVLVGGGVFLFARARVKKVLAQHAGGPFAYGVPMAPVPGAVNSWVETIATVPATVSVEPFVDPMSRPGLGYGGQLQAEVGMQVMKRPHGQVHLKMPLGPQWPNFSVLQHDPGHRVGLAIARSAGTAGTVVPTGDPAFDATFTLQTSAADPSIALRVFNPQVRAAMLSTQVVRLLIGGGMWLTTGYMRREDERAAVDWIRWFGAMFVAGSGLPVIPAGDASQPGTPAVPRFPG